MSVLGSGVDAANEYSRLVIGAAIEVHRRLGPGLPEAVYEKALTIELTHRGIPFVCQPVIQLHYRGQPIGEGRLDLLVGGVLVVELKAVSALNDAHVAQVLAYLRTADYPLALLINFNVAWMREGIKRIINTMSAA